MLSEKIVGRSLLVIGLAVALSGSNVLQVVPSPMLGNLNQATVTALSNWCFSFMGDVEISPFTPVCQTPISVSGTVKNFRVVLGAANTGGPNLVLTLNKNGTDTAVVVNIAQNAVAGVYSDLVHTVSVAAGDLLSWHAVTDGAGGATPITMLETFSFQVQQ